MFVCKAKLELAIFNWWTIYQRIIFIIALKRFDARRGRPLRIYSDNGTNFVSANNALLKFLKQLNEEKVQNFCEPKEIE